MLSGPCALMESRPGAERLQMVVFNENPVLAAKRNCVDTPGSWLRSLLLTECCCSQEAEEALLRKQDVLGATGQNGPLCPVQGLACPSCSARVPHHCW